MLTVEAGFWGGKFPMYHRAGILSLHRNSPNTHDRLVRDLVRATGYAIVFPYYTPAPDTQYPVQYEQCYAVILYIAANGASLGLKTDKFAICGDSVGGMTFLYPPFPASD
jgi:acetyl esterase/lipase